MPYKIDSIEFDFEENNDILRGTDEEWKEYQQMVIDDVLSTTWIVNDEEDLVDEISDVTGWCIKSIEYHLK